MSDLNIEKNQEPTRKERATSAVKKAAKNAKMLLIGVAIAVSIAFWMLGAIMAVVFVRETVFNDDDFSEQSSFSFGVECAEGMRPVSYSAEQNADVQQDVAYEVEVIAWKEYKNPSDCVTTAEYDAYVETAKANIQQREINKANAAERETAEANALETEALGMINSGSSADDVIALLVNKTCYYETVNNVLPLRAAELYESVWFYSPLSNAQASLYYTLDAMNCPGAYAFEIPEDVYVDNNYNNSEYSNNTILVPSTAEVAPR